MLRFPVIVLIVFAFTVSASLSLAEEWRIPLAGNTFKSSPTPGREGFQQDGTIAWSDPEAAYSVFFRCDRSARISLSLPVLKVMKDASLSVRVQGREFEVEVNDRLSAPVVVGTVDLKEAGYVRVDLWGKKRSGETFGAFDELVIHSDEKDLVVDYVRNNEGNMFYWGRRGPSAHLRYEVPANREIQYAYNEVTVPEGEDAIGSFFMANGFGEGYFGIQVNSATERRVLFSVWSPFKTDNPRDIPEDQRIETLGRGEEVHIGEFGNEGSGGQSYLRFPWKAGKTYRFLTEVKPAGDNKTVYTCWFGSKAENTWFLIASFRRPKTDTSLKGFHSFIENFSPAYGHISRRAHYGNTWVRDTDGQWHECVKARFSVDATARGRHRLDYQGGFVEGAFFLRNCGFFSETGTPGETYVRDSTKQDCPEIVFETLPRESATEEGNNVQPPAGRLAIVADGNSPDPDDIGATAVMFGLLKGAGLGDRLVHLSHSCDLDPFTNPGSRQKISEADEWRRQKKLHELCGEGIELFGPFENLAAYYNCRTDRDAAVIDLRDAVNASSADDPLWIVEAGEPDLIGYALEAATEDKRQFVHVISHHPANDNSGDVFTWQQILDFGVKEHQIGDQNKGLQTPPEFWDWAKNHTHPGIAWIWEQLDYAERDGVVKFQTNRFDCSDAGIIYWWITGADNGGNRGSTSDEMKALLLSVKDTH